MGLWGDDIGAVADPFKLRRFVEAQKTVYEQALSEIKGGRKRSHWMWFIFPQISGLGSSVMSERYSIRSSAEAEAYLSHPVLGSRLLESVEATLKLEGLSANEIFDYPDDLKLQSCATLFSSVVADGSVFHQLLDKYFAGDHDDETIRLIIENDR